MSKTFDINELHGNVIDYSQIRKIPIRNAFLDKKIYETISNDINIGNKLLFMPSNLHEMHLQEKKYAKSKYCIVLFGVLLDGRRASVVINGITPYFEVMIPETCNNSSELAMEIFNNLQQDETTKPDSFEIIKGRKFKGYSPNKQTFVKFYFDKLKIRKAAIKIVREKNYDTTSDDINSYYRLVCRDYLTTFSSWVYISNYTIKSYQGIRGNVFNIDIKDYKKCYDDITKNPLLAKDNIMTACWDIETYSPDGQLPVPDNPDHKMFMIGITFQWHHANDQILRICLIDHPCKPRPNYLTIVCEDEKKLIKAFAKVMYKMKPEYYLGFNDGEYDWPWLIKRSMCYPGVLAFLSENLDATINWKGYDDVDSIFNYNFKKEKVKIEADIYAYGQTLVYPGYINVDVRTVFRQLYPTAEKSNLNFYLSLNKLGGKKDMPYQEIFRIYGELNALMTRRSIIKDILKQFSGASSLSDDICEYIDKSEYDLLTDTMAEIADYCVIDSQRCHELMKIRSVVMDRREVADMSYTTMYDAYYRANGMKVRNLVIARGQQFGIRFSNITNSGEMEPGKYPGAFVFTPKKGLVTSKLSIAERIEHTTLMPEYSEWIEVNPGELEIYNEIINEYGATCSKEIINTIIEKYTDCKIKKCFIDFLLEPTGRPVTGLDFSSLYPSLMMTYNFSPEYMLDNMKEAKLAHANGHSLYKIKFMYNGRIVRGWSIRHDNNLDPNSKDCKFGVYPLILKELFDSRSQMKKGLHKWENEKEKMDTLSREELMKPENQVLYENICFNFSLINSKQKALKVFMNTFYGESGNKRSPFFVLQLAGAITTAGQDNIKMVQKFVEKEECGMYYGDSVTGDTPLILRNRITKQVLIKTIDDIVNVNDWKSYEQFKPGEPDRIQKQQALCDFEIWTEGSWNDINRVIRHKTNKKMYRVNTHTGVIDVTEDHSLMTPDRTKIKPGELKIGSELMHSFPTEFPEILTSVSELDCEMVHCARCALDKPWYEFYKKKTGKYIKPCRKCAWISNARNRKYSLMSEYFSQHEYVNNLNEVSKEEAYVWGFFMADGSCGLYECPSGAKSSWAINNQNITYLNQALEYLAICEPHLKFKLLDTLKSSGVYKLVAQGHVKLIVEKYRKIFYDKRKYKLVPIQILNGSREIRQSFYDGYYVGDGCKTTEQKINYQVFCCKGKITSQCMYYLVKSLGYKYISILTQEYKPDIYWMNIATKKFNKNPIAVKKILELPSVNHDTFVYDIETSKGSFNGGVGGLTGFNTDSLYITMPEKNFIETDKKYYTGAIKKLDYWKSLVDITFEIITPIRDAVNTLLKLDNGTSFLKMAFEESLYPVTYLAKKKYYGIAHISIANFDPKELFIKGCDAIKRGVSEFLRKICMNIMWASVSITNVYTLIQLVEKKIDTIYETKWDFNDFVTTDVFKPDKQNVKVQTFVARMLKEGIIIKPYTRFSHVITKKNPFRYDERGRKIDLSVGEKMELAEHAAEMNMEIDIDYYMQGSISGQLARLIVYDSSFHVNSVSDDPDDLKIADVKIYKNACDYVDKYCSKFYTNYKSKGKIYQKIFRMANKVVINNLKHHYGNETISLLNKNYDIDNLEEWITITSEKNAIKSIKNYGKKHVDLLLYNLKNVNKTNKLKSLQDIYFANKCCNIIMTRERIFKDRHAILQRNLRDNINEIIIALKCNSAMVKKISNSIKSSIDIDNKFNEPNSVIPNVIDIPFLQNIDSIELNEVAINEVNNLLSDEKIQLALNKLKYIHVNMVSNYTYINKTRFIVEYLKICRNNKLRMYEPNSVDIAKIINDSVSHTLKNI
jgi:DNA polymerase elongation subunit (family B)